MDISGEWSIANCCDEHSGITSEDANSRQLFLVMTIDIKNWWKMYQRQKQKNDMFCPFLWET